MGHKSLEERREYMRNWRAGIVRTEADEEGRDYIDEPVTKEVIERDRIMRMRTQMRKRARERRKEQAKETCARLKREIERLSVNPFSKLVNR